MNTPTPPVHPPVRRGICGLCGGTGARLYPQGWRDNCRPVVTWWRVLGAVNR